MFTFTRSFYWFCLLAFTATGFYSSPAFSSEGSHGKSAIYQMAEIMHRLKHYPSPAGKEVLKGISQAKSTTENERVLATAMINLEHAVASSDAPKLKALINNGGASTHERELAGIILNLDHRPSSKDKAQLKAMMK
jgi:hypothetical protein